MKRELGAEDIMEAAAFGKRLSMFDLSYEARLVATFGWILRRSLGDRPGAIRIELLRITRMPPQALDRAVAELARAGVGEEIGGLQHGR